MICYNILFICKISITVAIINWKNERTAWYSVTHKVKLASSCTVLLFYEQTKINRKFNIFDVHWCDTVHRVLCTITTCQDMITSSNGNIFRDTGPLLVESNGHCWIPSQKPVTRSSGVFFSFKCAWTNGWANNGYVGDLRRRHAHYDVNVMTPTITLSRHESWSCGSVP